MSIQEKTMCIETNTSQLMTWMIQSSNRLVEFYVESVLYPLLNYLLEKNEQGRTRLWVESNAKERERKKLLTLPSFRNNDINTMLSSVIQYCVAKLSNLQFLTIIPIILLPSKDNVILPFIFIVFVTIGEFELFRQTIEEEKYVILPCEEENKTQSNPVDNPNLHISDDKREADFEIVTLLSKKRILNSWRTNRDAIMGEQFYRTMSHSAFVIPLWIHLLSQPRNGFWHYCCLLWLIVNNTFSAFAACQIFFSALPPTPQEDGIKPKMAWEHSLPFLELVGAAFWLLPPTRIFRHVALIVLMCFACPLAHSVLNQQKNKYGVVYVSCDADNLDYRLIRHWMKSRSMGTKLIVGVIDKTDVNNKEEQMERDTMVKNICSIPSVDQVITGAPTKVDLAFLEKYGIDCVVGTEAMDEVVHEGKCWIIEDLDQHLAKVRQVMVPARNVE